MNSPDVIVSDDIDYDSITFDDYLAGDFTNSTEDDYDDDASLSKDDYLDDDLVAGIYDSPAEPDIPEDNSSQDFLYDEFI